MSHISKNILKSKIDLINVNLMRGKSDNKVCASSDPKKVFRTKSLAHKKYSIRIFRDALLASSFLLFAFNGTTVAQQIYDGNAGLLTLSDSISGNLQNMIGGNLVQGFIARDDNGEPILSGANAVIDFSNGTIPGFVAVGYSGLFDTKEKTSATNGNVLTLINGTADGDIFVGLTHFTDEIATKECLSLGKCDIKSQLSEFDLQANNNKIQYNLNNTTMKSGRLNAGVATVRQILGDVKGGASSSHYVQAYTELKQSTLTSEGNTIILNGEKNNINDRINAGEASVYHYVASVQAGTAASATGKMASDVLNNNFTSNKNSVIILGNENKILGSLNAGTASVLQDLNNFQGGDYSGADVRSLSNAKNNNLTADNNTININSFGNIVTGDANTGTASIIAKYGDIRPGKDGFGKVQIDHYVYYSELNSNSNLTSISGSDNVFKGDMNTGSSVIINEHGNAEAYEKGNAVSFSPYTRYNNLFSNENTIRILGDRNNVSGSLNAGNALIAQNFGILQGTGGIYANAHLDTNELISNGNKIEILGNNNSISGDLNAGAAQLQQRFGGINGDAEASIYLNNTKFYSNDNSIDVAGYGNVIKGNLIAGKAGFDFSIDDPKDINALKINVGNVKMEASNNKINIAGSTEIGGSIYGGYVNLNIGGPDYSANVNITSNVDNADSVNNTVSISGNHKIGGKDTAIYGGYLSYSTINGKTYKPKKYDVFTGNTLEYANMTPITIGTIGNFQTYNFTLNPELANSQTALITADQIFLGTNSENTSSKADVKSDVFVTGIHSGNVLPTGTEFILMQGSIDGEGQGHSSKDVKQIQQGISLLYDVETKVDKDNGRVTAVILEGHDPVKPEPEVNPQLKSLMEGNLSGLMLLTRQADNIADNTFNVITEQNRHKGLVPFIQASGHTSRYKTGSHIDADGMLVTGGLSYQAEQLTAAAFLEYGTADYDSYNAFAKAASVHGKGDNRYYGAGLYGQYDFTNNFYMDASFRGGRLRTNYSTADIRNAATGEAAQYTLNGNYMSAHVGAGYTMDLNDANKFNTSLKYLWTQTDSHDAIVAGDAIHFDRLKSNRIRLNAENEYKFAQNWLFLAGMGLEYEFDAKAGGKTYNRFDIDAPSVRGFTTLGTLGIRYQPTMNDRISVDFKGNAYLGKREGGNLSVKLQYAF